MDCVLVLSQWQSPFCSLSEYRSKAQLDDTFADSQIWFVSRDLIFINWEKTSVYRNSCFHLLAWFSQMIRVWPDGSNIGALPPEIDDLGSGPE